MCIVNDKAIDELGLHDRTIVISPVGCSVFAYNYFDLDAAEAARQMRFLLGRGFAAEVARRVVRGAGGAQADAPDEGGTD